MWVGSTSVKGGTPPYLAPYFAAKAAMDSLAVSYAAELARWGIETTIVVPGAFTTGTNHFANSGAPDDTTTARAYKRHYAGMMEQVAAKLAELSPPDVDASIVAEEIARVVALPTGTRPFRCTSTRRTTDRRRSAGWRTASRTTSRCGSASATS